MLPIHWGSRPLPSGGVPCPHPLSLSLKIYPPAGIAFWKSSFDVRYADGADRGQLLAALADVDAVIVRSATQIDAEAIAAGRRLRVVARAGVGLDNVDVEAATKAGVMVVNAPASNVVSAAEHAVALLLALARNVPQATASLKNGQWKRSAYTGVELQDKVVGILGLGRIGALVAERLAAFDMTVIAYDPYAPPATLDAARRPDGEPRGAAGRGRLHHRPPAEERRDARVLSATASCTWSSPRSASSMPPAAGSSTRPRWPARFARAGSPAPGIDVYASEPCTDSPLFGFDNVVVTPHLGREHERGAGEGGHAGRQVGPAGP